MKCISVTEYICERCGYITTRKPYGFPNCPACSGKAIYSDNTKEESKEVKE